MQHKLAPHMIIIAMKFLGPKELRGVKLEWKKELSLLRILEKLLVAL